MTNRLRGFLALLDVELGRADPNTIELAAEYLTWALLSRYHLTDDT